MFGKQKRGINSAYFTVGCNITVTQRNRKARSFAFQVLLLFPPEYSVTFVVLSQFDSDGDGQISLTELREAMKKLMGEQVTNREISEILKDVDLNGDGQVDFEGKREFRRDHFSIEMSLHSFLWFSQSLCG